MASVKNEKIRKERREASRLASKANKRVNRLKNAGLTDSPAYQKYIEDGGAKFSVKGKSYNELQSEVSRLNRFINSQTSTIRGYNRSLKEIAANTGIKYKNMADLKKKSSKFFELSSKVEQYLRNVEDMASAIGYQKIWEAVNQYVQTNEGALEHGEDNIDSMVKAVSDGLKRQQGENKTVSPTVKNKEEKDESSIGKFIARNAYKLIK